MPTQYSALENQMGEERRSRENKLRERLEKKRLAKQEEIEKEALSAAVNQIKQTNPVAVARMNSR